MSYHYGFGKAGMVPAPPPQTPSQMPMQASAVQAVKTNPPVDDDYEAEMSEQDEIRLKYQQLKAAHEAEVKRIHEMNARQAAYTRDTVQNRPKEAGYATESEKIMGAQTGYGNLPASILGHKTWHWIALLAAGLLIWKIKR